MTPQEQNNEYVFISYSRKDMSFVEKINQELLNGNITTWIDYSGIKIGTHWDNSIQDAIKNCQSLIVVLSPNSVESVYVMDEISFAIEKKKFIIPVLYENCSIPLRINRIQYIDFTEKFQESIELLKKIILSNDPTKSRSNSKIKKIANYDVFSIEQLDVNIAHNHKLGNFNHMNELLLEKAKLHQKKGEIQNAYSSLDKYAKISKIKDNEYYLCIGKIISQTSKTPEKLQTYITYLENIKGIEKNELAALYWRLSILYQPFNIRASTEYNEIHKHHTGDKEYQIAHNIQCKALGEIFTSVQNKNLTYTDKIITRLHDSYTKYSNIKNFTYYDKCILSNILMTAIVDYILGRKIQYYKKLFYCRYMFINNNIHRYDEAMSEIFFSIQTINPESFIILFQKNIWEFIEKHAYSDFLVEIYNLTKEEIKNDHINSVALSKTYERLLG